MREIILYGNWKAGWAVDLHTVKSVPAAGPGSFHTTYSEVGEALNRLKYHDDRSQIPVLGRLSIEFLETNWAVPYLDIVIPVPPSNLDCSVQPVYEVARLIEEHFHIRVDDDYILKNRQTDQLKGIDDPLEREALLREAFTVRDARYKDGRILLFDDLYRSGSILREITNVLYQEGEVKDVYVLTLTKTRVKK